MSDLVPVSPSGLMPHSMNEAMQLAEFMARARTVPKHLQDSPGDCLMVIEQAMRWGMSPFAVAQATSVISGKMMYEGKLVAAAVETSGAIVGHLDYEYSGEGDGRSIAVSATRRGETNPRTVTVTFKEARTENAMWKRQPDQQLCYHGARVWARRWAPAVILGVYSREEMGPVIEGDAVEHATQSNPQVGQSALNQVGLQVGQQQDLRSAYNTAVPMRAAAATTQRAERVVDPTVYEADPQEQPRPRTRGSFLDALEIALRDAQSAEEVDRIVCGEDSMRAKETFEGAHKERYTKLVDAALKKWWHEPPAGEDLPDVEIAGSEKLAAG